VALLVRPVRSSDDDPLRELLRAYATEFDALIDTDVRVEAASASAAYRLPDGRMLVAEADGEVVGCVAWRRVGDACEMKRMVVQPDARGNGVGRALADAILADAAAAGFRRMFLVTTEAMAAARALYATLGFRPSAPYRPTRVGCALTMDLALATQA